MKTWLFTLCFLYLARVNAQAPKVSLGSVTRVANFQSKYISARNVDIWLPPGFSNKNKYAVLYMHDGQMLFDSTTTWNKTAWNVDKVLAPLMKEQKIRNVIVVGIWNGGSTRHAEYFPQKPYELLTQVEKDTVRSQLRQSVRTKEGFNPTSDLYLKFLVEELKPFIDGNYPTASEKNSTFIAGSSMGGLISLYALCEYPTVFGGAACMSTHWPGSFSANDNPMPEAFRHYLAGHLPNPESHKIYFDYGDKTLDALYPPLQAKVDEVLKAKGFTERNWVTRFFPGDDHSERSWSKRLAFPALFLLKK